jgi:hypothetical protein
MIDNITPEVFGRLLESAKTGVNFMEMMVACGTFPSGCSREGVLGHMELAKRAIYEAEFPTPAEKVDAFLNVLSQERGENDPLVLALNATLLAATDAWERAEKAA